MTNKSSASLGLGLRDGVEGALLADARLEQHLVAAQLAELSCRRARYAPRKRSPGAATSAQAMAAQALAPFRSPAGAI